MNLGIKPDHRRCHGAQRPSVPKLRGESRDKCEHGGKICFAGPKHVIPCGIDPGEIPQIREIFPIEQQEKERRKELYG